METTHSSYSKTGPVPGTMYTIEVSRSRHKYKAIDHTSDMKKAHEICDTYPLHQMERIRVLNSEGKTICRRIGTKAGS